MVERKGKLDAATLANALTVSAQMFGVWISEDKQESAPRTPTLP